MERIAAECRLPNRKVSQTKQDAGQDLGCRYPGVTDQISAAAVVHRLGLGQGTGEAGKSERKYKGSSAGYHLRLVDSAPSTAPSRLHLVRAPFQHQTPGSLLVLTASAACTRRGEVECQLKMGRSRLPDDVGAPEATRIA